MYEGANRGPSRAPRLGGAPARNALSHCKDIPGTAATVSKTTRSYSPRPQGRSLARCATLFGFRGIPYAKTGRAPQQCEYGIHYNRIQRPGLSADRTSLGVAKRWLMDPCHGGCCNFESWYYRYDTTSSEAPNCLQNQGR
jgi:hypothetical protein